MNIGFYFLYQIIFIYFVLRERYSTRKKSGEVASIQNSNLPEYIHGEDKVNYKKNSFQNIKDFDIEFFQCVNKNNPENNYFRYMNEKIDVRHKSMKLIKLFTL